MQPFEKGNLLERAVHAIEVAILRSSPALRENTFKIESKKRVAVAGVRHEIDIYVKVDIGNGYESIFIFECKNWDTPVGKNEIIIFSEKVHALQAQRGFFIAKAFSSDAEAQAKSDARLELKVATEHDASITRIPFDFHYLWLDKSAAKVRVEFSQRDVVRENTEPQILDGAQSRLRLLNSQISFQEYMAAWAEEIVHNYTNINSTMSLAEGIYQKQATAVRRYEPGQLVVNGCDIAEAEIQIEFKIQIIRLPIISHFEVATRGRSISFAPVTTGTATSQAAFVFYSPKPA